MSAGRRDDKRRGMLVGGLPTSPWREDGMGGMMRMDELPFRSEDGGGRRTKHRPNTAKPMSSATKSTVFVAEDAASMPAQRRVPLPASVLAAGMAIPMTKSVSAAPVAKEGIAATLEWELSEHEGLLTALEGRKRWFHCTRLHVISRPTFLPHFLRPQI